MKKSSVPFNELTDVALNVTEVEFFVTEGAYVSVPLSKVEDYIENLGWNTEIVSLNGKNQFDPEIEEGEETTNIEKYVDDNFDKCVEEFYNKFIYESR